MQAYQFKLDFLDNLFEFQDNLKKTFSGLDVLQNKVNAATAPMDNMRSSLNGLGGMLTGAFAVAGIVGFGPEVVSTLAEFEKYEAVLTNTFGSNSMAKSAFADIQKFAAETPFGVDKLTESFVKLQNRGINASMGEMTQLGDIASSQGKDFDQLTEALLDAQTNQFERLNEFGIKAQKSGNKLMMSFKGINKTVANTPEAIKNAMLEFGNMQGVKGSMAAISKTTGGMISNLGDQFNMLKYNLGLAFAPFLADIIPKMSEGLAWFSEKITAFAPVIKGFLGQAGTMFQGIMTFMQPITDVLMKLGTGVMNVVVKQFQNFNAMLNNNMPSILIIRDRLAFIGDLLVSILVPAFDVLGTVITFVIGEIVNATAYIIDLENKIGQSFMAVFDFIYNAYATFYGGIIDITDAIFPGFRNAFDSVKNWLYDTFIKPISEWFNKLFNFEDFTKITATATMTAEEEAYRSGDTRDKETATKPTKRGDLGLDKRTGGKGENGVSGGTNIKHITINITKLVERIEVHTSNVKDGAADIKAHVIGALMGAVNDANYAN